MDALDAYLGGAGQVRGQDEAWAAGRASSQDAINRFNAANEQAVSGRNIDRSMEGQQATFSQGFQKASGVGSAAGAYQGMADDTQKRAHNIGKGIGGGIGAAVPVLSDERFKADVVREAEEALPGVPFATWEWPDQPGVRHRGVIAQDLERVAPEHVFTRGDGVKFADYSFLGGEALAVGGNLADPLTRRFLRLQFEGSPDFEDFLSAVVRAEPPPPAPGPADVAGVQVRPHVETPEERQARRSTEVMDFAERGGDLTPFQTPSRTAEETAARETGGVLRGAAASGAGNGGKAKAMLSQMAPGSAPAPTPEGEALYQELQAAAAAHRGA
jgi:hypothetical protein